MKPHKFAAAFPPMTDREFIVLKEHIETCGQRTPIIVWRGQILDGVHRARACAELNIEPLVFHFDGDEKAALDEVIAKNLIHRHLDESQRAMVGAKLATMTVGGDRKSGNHSVNLPNDISQADASDLLNVSVKAIGDAKKVLKHGTPELIEQVERGEVAVSKAAKQVRAEAPPKIEAPPKDDASPSGGSEVFTLPQWKALSEDERRNALAVRGNGQYNKQDNESIEWAQWSWNPITGCKHDCPYCYARDIANRFFETKFEPAIYPSRLAAPTNTKVPQRAAQEIAYRNVFTCSMADLFGRWVPAEWIQSVLDVVRENQQWNFLFLTKFPKRLSQFSFPQNAWVGTTVDCQARVKSAEDAFENVDATVKWLSIEPMIEPLTFTRLDLFDWLVIGGASKSNQTPEWRVPLEWWAPLHVEAKRLGLTVYHKSNLFDREHGYPTAPHLTPAASPAPFQYLKQKSKVEIEQGEA